MAALCRSVLPRSVGMRRGGCSGSDLNSCPVLPPQIPEVLLWAKEQNEEKSPNLTQFTEHFNNMSYW